jgi:hypothetical protein
MTLQALHRQERSLERRQRGAAAVEFGLVSFFFFTLLLGIVELGRLMYVWNSVQEVTRRAAREAVVSDFSTTQQVKVQRQAVFYSEDGDNSVLLPGTPEISAASVRLSYLNASLTEITTLPASPAENLSFCGDVTLVANCIRYVRAEVCTQSVDENGVTQCNAINYQPWIGFLLGVGGIDFNIPIPVSPVVMPAESLGFYVS